MKTQLISCFSLLLAVGCSDPVSPADDDDDDSPAPAGCPAPSGPGTTHTDTIDTDTTWTAADSPHRVDFDVAIRAKLTVEPCAVVEVVADRGLTVRDGGTLIAAGAQDRPVVFRGQNGQRWLGIGTVAGATMRLSYASIERAGAYGERPSPSLVLVGDGVLPADPMFLADHLTVKDSLGAGVALQRGATFAAGSTALTVTGSGSYPVELEEHSIDALPVGRYTGNAIDELLLELYGTGTAGAGLSVDATLHERGVPYHVGRDALGTFIVGSGEDGTLSTLTIEPGVVLKMNPGTAFKIQHWTTDRPSTGAIRAVGMADRPIVFTSAAAAPKAGDWMGLWFGGLPSENNQVENARIEYAGGECGCILSSCSAIDSSEGAVIFTAQPPSRFIRNTVVKESAGHGFTQGFDGTSLDFTASNFFENVQGCMLTEPRSVDTSCPVNPKPACK